MIRQKPLDCIELVEVVTDYLERNMSRRERRRFEAHLRECDGCTTYLVQIRQTIETTGRLTEDSIEPAAREALLTAFRDWRRARPA
jgi:hypothetical protein